MRCVVAAGWAVDDAAASAFATTFYEALLRGQRFIDAVAVARAKAFEFDGNTWAAYQCYGDPDWTIRRRETGRRQSPHAREDEFDDVGSVAALGLALETHGRAVHVSGGTTRHISLNECALLEQRWEKMGWSTSSDVAELFASAYAASGDLANAIRWYETAIATTEGNVSFKAFEQVSNLRVRSALKNVSEAASELDRLVVSPPAQGARKRGTRAAGSRGRARQLADAKRHVRAATEKARATIRNEMKRLDQLSAFQETVERESMRGSAMKRLAVLETGAGRKEAARRALAAMARHYSRALDLARERKADNAFYPAINLIAAELALRGGTKQWKGLPASLFDEAWRDVEAKNQDSPDFWSLIAGPELQLYKAVAQGNLPSQATAIVRSLRDVHRRSQGGSEWASVVDTLRFALAPYLARATSARTKKAIRNVIDQVVTLAARAPGRS